MRNRAPDRPGTEGLPGVVTVFFAAASLLIFGFFCALLEGGRTAVLRALFREAVFSAADSVLAAYHTDVLREYGLLMCDAGLYEEEWLGDARSYLVRYMEPSAGLLFGADDRIRMERLELTGERSLRLTDDHGRVFGDAVLTYMRSAGLSVIVKEVLTRLGVTDESAGEDLSGTVGSFLTGESFSLGDIVGRMGELKEKAEEIRREQEEAQEGEDDGEEAPEPPPEPTREDLARSETGSGFLEAIRALAENGLLALVVGGQTLYDETVRAEILPSSLSETWKGRNAGAGRTSFGLADTFLFGEYAFHTMSCLTAKGRGYYHYELEYVLTGLRTGTAALAAVAGLLALIRTGFNFAYLLTDADKLFEAELVGTSIASAIYAPALAPAFKWLLVAAWAVAESIADVRHLMKGDRVPLFKTAGSWRLQALSLSEREFSDGGRGLGYEDYLRLLFYLGNRENESYRMMDVIENRMRKIDRGFRMRAMMTGLRLGAEADVGNMYLILPVFRQMSGAGTHWRLRERTEKSYGRR